jgi:N-acetylneuraminic acid mutarotase
MTCPTHLACLRIRLWLGLAAFSCSFVTTPVANAQIPVITNPADLRFLNLNEAFDPLDPAPSWTAKAPMPTARAGFAISAASDATSEKIYVIGGRVVGHDCPTIQTVEAYDPATDTWTGLAEPTAKRWRAAAGTLRGIIYLAGGVSTEGGVCGDVVSTVEAYDPVANSWSTRMPMNTARTLVSLAVDDANDNGNNKLYAIGGATADFTALPTVEVYDASTGMWTPIADMNTARALPSVGVGIDGKIYAVGGQTIGQVAIDTVEYYDPSNPSTGWTLQASHMPFPRLNAGAAVLEGKIYVAGGEDQGPSDAPGPSSTVQVYDPSSDSWTTEASMPTGRHVLGAAVVEDKLYAVGGEAPTGTVGQQLTLQITATNNPTSYAASRLPPGLSLLDPALGIISGVPTTNVGSPFLSTFTATNGSGTSQPKNVSFSIKASPTPAPSPISIISSTCATARAGQPFAFQVVTNNASETGAQLSASGLPYDTANQTAALTIDPGTGFISGTVNLPDGSPPQSFGVPVSLTDLSTTPPSTTQYLLQLTFVSDPAVPIIKSSHATVVLNQYFSYTITPDAPADSFDYIGIDGLKHGPLPTCEGLPPGLCFDGVTISGTYTPEIQSAPDTIKIRPRESVQLIAHNSTGTGTGTAPLNLTIGLHDFEIEALTTQASAPYAIFTTDPKTSGHAAGILKEDNVGDSVTYTVPIAVAGTYYVKVGTKTNQGHGKFQLAIDGLNQGTPQDEYSAAMGYKVFDLGPHTFVNAENSSFQFTVVDKNPLSIGYRLVFDYIDLVPRSEAENLPAQHTAPLSIVMDDHASGGFYSLLQATTVGDSVTYTVPIAVAGTYDVKVGVKQRSDKGIFQLTIDGANQGYAQDEYSPAVGYNVLDLGTHTFNPPNSLFQFTVTEKNPMSSNYTLAFDYIDLVLATALETETLTVSANTAPYTYFPDPELSGGEGTLLEAIRRGDYITFTIPIAVTGVYNVKVGVRTNTDEGKFQLFINGSRKAQGTEQDEYSPAVGYKVLDLGTVRFTTTGDQMFQFKVTNKNSLSSGYQLAFDYIDLVR